MKKNNKIMGFVAVLLAAVMIAGAILSAQAAGTLSSSDIDKIVNTETDASLVANPFTAAVAAVRDSVVLVNNYQTTTYNNNSYGFFYGYGYGNPYGNGRGGTTSREQLRGHHLPRAAVSVRRHAVSAVHSAAARGPRTSPKCPARTTGRRAVHATV